MVEPSSGYQVSTDIHEFSKRYEWMAEDKTLPIVLLDNLDYMSTAFYAPASVTSQLVFVVWPKEDILMGEMYPRLRACCNAEPAVVGLADFLASHDTFLVYGGLRSVDRLQYFVNDGATVKTKRESGDHYLVLVTYKKRSMHQPFR